MKEVSGVVYDAATRKPLSGVRVQALNNRYYTAMTDEQGVYHISVPEHDRTFRGIIKTGTKLHQRTLSASRRSDKGCQRALTHGNTDIM